MTDRSTAIRERFEQALVDGLQGQPLVSKDGPVLNPDGVIVMIGPEPSFLSVVRAYLKDLRDSLGKPRVPQTGKATSPLMQAAEKRGLPFGSPRVQ